MLIFINLHLHARHSALEHIWIRVSIHKKIVNDDMKLLYIYYRPYEMWGSLDIVSINWQRIFGSFVSSFNSMSDFWQAWFCLWLHTAEIAGWEMKYWAVWLGGPYTRYGICKTHIGLWSTVLGLQYIWVSIHVLMSDLSLLLDLDKSWFPQKLKRVVIADIMALLGGSNDFTDIFLIIAILLRIPLSFLLSLSKEVCTISPV